MKELGRTNNSVQISVIRSLLDEKGIELFMVDENSGAVLQGLYGVLPRLFVIDDEFEQAVAILRNAGIKL